MSRLRFTAIGLLGLLSACHSTERRAQFGGTTVSHNDQSGATTISNKGGTLSTISGAQARAVDLPAFAPRYPGSSVDYVLDTSGQKGHALMVRLSTGDPGAAVLTFYRHCLTSNGYPITEDVALPDGGMLQAAAHGHMVSVTVSPMDGTRAIILSISDA